MRTPLLLCMLVSACATSEEVDSVELAVDDELAGDDCADPIASVTVCGGDLMCVCSNPLSVTGPFPQGHVCAPGCFPVVPGTADDACAFAEAAAQSLEPARCGYRGNTCETCLDMGTSGSRELRSGNCCAFTKTRTCGPYTWEDMIGHLLPPRCGDLDRE